MTAAGTRPDPGFVGRVDEVARLMEAVGSSRAGSSPLCLVLGEAGIGKSRLAARVAGEARGLDFDVVWTEAEEGAGPFAALAGLRARADAALAGDDARWDKLDAVVAAITARAPVLVIVEDFHWADDSSAWVVERLGRQLHGVAAPLLVTARSDEPSRDRIGRLVASADHVVRLAGMSLAETTRLAELAAPGTAVDGSGLWERTGGVPLFVREAAVLAAEGGGPSLATEVLRRRFERLGAETARILATVALAPGGTSLLVLARALDRPVEVVAGAVDVGRAEELVVDEPGGGIRFRHALLAEAAAKNLAGADQRALRSASPRPSKLREAIGPAPGRQSFDFSRSRPATPRPPRPPRSRPSSRCGQPTRGPRPALWPGLRSASWRRTAPRRTSSPPSTSSAVSHSSS